MAYLHGKFLQLSCKFGIQFDRNKDTNRRAFYCQRELKIVKCLPLNLERILPEAILKTALGGRTVKIVGCDWERFSSLVGHL